MTTPTPRPPDDTTVEVEFVTERGQGRLIVTGPVLIGDAWRIREFDVDGLCSPLTIDLSAVSALDVAGVAAISDLARRIMRAGRGVHVVGPTAPDAQRVAAMTGIFDLLNRQSPVAFAVA